VAGVLKQEQSQQLQWWYSVKLLEGLDLWKELDPTSQRTVHVLASEKERVIG
jgi:hypothetical protein